MTVYRIVTPRWSSALIGSGRPARWNTSGEEVLYTAEHRSLALLENMVHRSSAQLDDLFSVMVIELDDQIPVYTLSLDLLSPFWLRTGPRSLSYCRQMIFDFREQQKEPPKIIRVPSAVVTGEYNVLLYTEESDLSWLKIKDVEPFMVDNRL